MRALPFAALTALALAAAPARAASNDLNIIGLVERGDADGDGTPNEVDNDAFRALVREFGVTMTPTSMQPAETTGQSGFDFALDYSFHTSTRYEEGYWQNTRENPSTPLLMTLGARARKGFILPVPLASEVEFGANWLIDSRLMTLGTNLRLALNEGFRWIPDIAVQAGINRLVGNKDLDLLTVTAGGQISKGFGIAGSLNLCPFVGYQAIWVNGSSRIVDAGPDDQANVNDNVVFTQVPLGGNQMDRVSFGARVVIAVVQITGGMDLNFIQPVSGTNAGGEAEMHIQYSIRAGVTF